MRVSSVMCRSAIVCLVVLASSSVVWGSTIYDDFGGLSVDPTNWTTVLTGNGTATEASHNLSLNVPNSTSEVTVLSVTTWSYDTFSFKIGAAGTGTQPADIFGISTFEPYGGNRHMALLRNDLGGGWRFYAADAGAHTPYTSAPLAVAPAADDLYSIVWKSDSVELLKNGASILTETSVIPNPSAGIKVIFQKYWLGGLQSTGGISPAYDWVAVGAVPEPGTLVLLATALIGLLAYAWRKRK